jgi:hypothetical protein
MASRGISLTIVLLLFSTGLFAQGTTSRAVGTVQDSSGALVPGATVRLTNEGTNATFTTTTSEAGTYVFEAVQPGQYTVSVEAAGFKKFNSKGNVVNIGAPMTVNVTLEVGQIAETVEVAGTYETVQTSTSGNFGNVFAGNVIRDLPIVGTRGRNPLDLVLRQPGVVSGANTGGGTHVHGARDRAWNYTIDGIDSNETSAGGSNFSPLRTNPDSLAEFKVLTGNFTAEYGRNSGGQVAMITKSGTNEFHGDAFWFYRTPRLHANEWQNNINNVRRPQFVQNIPGFSVGGPIQRNKTFFFFNQQWLRARESRFTSRTVYTQQARQGIFRYVIGGQNRPAGVAGASVDDSGNVLPGVTLGTYNIVTSDPLRLGLDPTIKGFIDAAPLPNNFTGGDGLNTALFNFTAKQVEKQYDTTMKFDHVINDKNTVYARLSFGRQDTTCDAVNGGLEAFPGTGCLVNTQRDPKNYAFNWRTTPSSRLTNEFVFGMNRFAFNFVTPTADLSKIAIAGAPVQMPVDYLYGNLRRLTTWQFVDNVGYFTGAHSFKFGTNLRLGRHQDTRGSIGGSNATQSANFSRTIAVVDPVSFGLPANIQQTVDRVNLETTINFLLGRVGSTSKSFVAENDQFVSKLYDVTAKYNEYDLFVQDTWKVRKNLTVDLGLRWEAKMTPTSDAGRIRRPDQAVAWGAAPSNTLTWAQGDFFRSDLNNFGPSVGMAWDPRGNGKTSVRVNYRLAYDRLNTFVISSAVLQNLPGVATAVTLQPNNVRYRNLQAIPAPTARPSASAQPPPFSLNNITVVDRNFETPQTHQWGLSVQHEIFSRTVLELNYIGRRAHNLFGAYNVNQVNVFNNGFLEAFRTVRAGGNSPLINQLMGADSRLNPGETGSQAMRRLFATDLQNNAVGTVAQALATRVQGGRSLPDLAGLGPTFFHAFPQFAGNFNVVDSNDFSTYHAFEAQIERRFSNGLSWQLSYTLSKSLDVRSFDPAFTVVSTGAAQSAGSTPFDAGNRKLNYALSDFDRTHVVQSYWVVELPFGRGKKFGNGAGTWANRAIGGWQLTGFATIASGRPFTVFSGFNTAGQVVNSTADCSGCTRKSGYVHDEGGLVWYLDPAERARFSQPGAGEFGNTGRNFFRGPGRFSMDAALLKRTSITERVSLELRADVTNVTNTPEFGFPTTTLNSPLFGRIRDSISSASRKFQLGAKIRF